MMSPATAEARGRPSNDQAPGALRRTSAERSAVLGSVLRQSAQVQYAVACDRYAVARDAKFDLSLSAALRSLASLRELNAAHELADAACFMAWLETRVYDPEEPRVPAGSPDGGQWVGDNGRQLGSGQRRHEFVRLAQNAPTGRFWTYRPTSFRLNGIEQDLNLQDEVLVGAATQARDMAVAQARAVDPTYRPQPGLYSSVDGYLADLRAQRDDAELFAINATRTEDGLPPLTPARYLSPTSPSLRNTPMIDLLEPQGQPIGWRAPGAGYQIRTVDSETFNDLSVRMTFGSDAVATRPGYDGVRFLRADGGLFGLRLSPDNGPTIDIFNYGLISKIHQK